MKKKILSGFAVLAIAVGAAFNMSINSSDGLSDISLANVEALARYELPSGIGMYDPDWDTCECCGIAMCIISEYQ